MVRVASGDSADDSTCGSTFGPSVDAGAAAHDACLVSSPGTGLDAASSTSGPVTRVDLHCHSDASSGPAVAALKLINCPESYSEPERVYEQARVRGMDLVTITDHDTIDGVMSLVNRGFPDVIIGEEVTVHFPEDHCKLHVLVWGLTPELHEEIGTLGLRDDVYLFAAWLHDRNLAHSLAHPVYDQNRKLTLWHLERCALLFKGFEILNGAHSGTHRSALSTFLRSLTPGRVHRLIEQHQLEPLWTRVWEKGLTGGSDDHGLLNVGRAWTQVAGKVTDSREFLKLIMAARSDVGGVAGHSSLLAHQLTSVGAQFAARRLLHKASPTGRYMGSKLLRFAGVSVQRPTKLTMALHLAKRKVGKLTGRLTGRRPSPLGPLMDAAARSFGPVLAKYPDLRAQLAQKSWADGAALSNHDRMAEFADDMHAALHGVLGPSALRAAMSKDHKALLDHLASYLVLEATQLPYLFSLFHQNKERPFLERMEHECSEPGAGVSVLDRPMRVMLFTDTLGDVNGVSRFIRNAATQALASGRELRVVTSTNFEIPSEPNIHNFAPVFATKMPKYENLELVLPPLVKMLRFVDKHQPDVIHISTPGSVGVVGMIAAKMLRVPVLGVYHTDFPAYIDHLFEDGSLTHITESFMKFFYAPFRSIFTRSQDYVGALEKLGIQRSTVLPLMPGIVTSQFHPRFRDEAFMESLGSPAKRVRALYVGRVSVEKNLPLLSQVWKDADARLREQGVDAELLIVGDGPYRAQMEKELRGTRVRFVGFRYGDELAKIYATSDLFVFPSVTDTLGQVVMESQASGMPVIVTDQGGPKEVVLDGVTGRVIPDTDTDGWVRAIVDLCADDGGRRRMGQSAHNFMQEFSMERSFEHFWQVHEQAWVEDLNSRGIKARDLKQAQRGVVEPVPTARMWTQEGRGSGVVHVASDLRAMREERNGQAGPGTHAAPDSHATT
jgi:glycosyltransferase involved in cell wall biosynthesis